MLMKWQEEGGINPLSTNKTLFNSALEEFSGRSFRDASLNNILKKAGMNKGSFYYRFHDKLDIYLSLIHCMGMDKSEFMMQNADANQAVGFFDGLRRQVVLGLRFAKKYPSYSAFWRRILVEEQDVKDAIFSCFGKISDDAISEAIEQGKSSGELRRDIPTKLATDVISTLLYRMDSLISPELNDDEILCRIDELFKLIKEGMSQKT